MLLLVLISLFLSTLSLRRATTDAINGCNSDIISIHALLAESDCTMTITICTASKFLSTLSLRRATSQQPDGKTRTTYFYPRSPCGERRKASQTAYRLYNISIHALLAESDHETSPCRVWENQFLSTLSLRRATRRTCHKCDSQEFLSTLSLRRATRRSESLRWK